MSPEEREQRAVASVLRPLGEYVMRVGMDKALGDYSREEIQGLVHTVLDSYRETLISSVREVP